MNQDSANHPTTSSTTSSSSSSSPQSNSDFLDRFLAATLHRFDCPSPDDLAAYAWQELAGKARSVVAQHLDTCAHCTEEYQFLRRSFNTAGIARAALADEALDQALLHQAVEKVKWFVAHLLPNPPALQPALRGAAATAAPQVYRVEELGWEVMVSVTATPSPAQTGYAISGSLLGPDEAALMQGRATLLQTGQETSNTVLDAAGWFDLTAPQPEGLTLWLELPDQRVELTLVAG